MEPIRGIKFPLQFHAGSVVTSTNTDHIRESVLQILAIGKKEYLMRPDFGCDLHRRIFTPVNIIALARGDIEATIKRYETRIDLLGVSLNLDRAPEGVLAINIDFRLKTTDEAVSVSTSFRR